jgi:hypothetical protein
MKGLGVANASGSNVFGALTTCRRAHSAERSHSKIAPVQRGVGRTTSETIADTSVRVASGEARGHLRKRVTLRPRW